MSTGPVELQGITINAGILETLQGFSTNRNVLKGITIAVGTGASIMQLKVVDRNHEPIEGATCRVLNAISGSNNVLSFDGVDDYVEIADSAELRFGTSDFCIAFWEYPEATGANNHVRIDKGGVSGSGSIYFYDNVGYRLRINGADVFSGIAIQTNQWNHVFIIRESDTIYFYRNNVLVNSYSGWGSVNINNSTNLYFGCEGQTTPNRRFFKGKLVDERWYSKALSPAERDDVYAGKELDADIISWWRMNEGVGPTATDSESSNNGTIYGATWAEVDDLPIETGIVGYDTTPYDSQTTNANGLTTLNYQINTIHGLEVTLPGKRRFIMPFERTTRGLLDWQVMLSDYLATFATDRGNILINSEPENNDSNFLIE